MRAWLLGTLGRLSGVDAACDEVVRRHLASNVEPDEWNRWWALEGLITGNASDLDDILTRAQADDSTLVKRLALVAKAARDDKKALKAIEAALENGNGEWETLRALRIVWLPPLAQRLCEIVHQKGFSETVYDAVRALGRVPRSSMHAKEAARTLAALIENQRRYSMWDSMRIHALATLGELGIADHAPVILADVTDDNPGVSRQATRSLEKTLGTRMATQRMMEAAESAVADRSPSAAAKTLESYATALRWMDRNKVVEELESIMVSGRPEQQDAARKILSEIGGLAAFQKLKAKSQLSGQYLSVLNDATTKVQELFRASTQRADRSFALTRGMDMATFGVGITLILVSAILALVKSGDLAQWGGGVAATGGLGVLGILHSTLISNPRRKIEESIEFMMKINVIFLGYLRQLQQCDQAFTRRVLDDKDLEPADIMKFTDVIDRAIHSAFDKLSYQPGAAVNGQATSSKASRAAANGPANEEPAAQAEQPGGVPRE